MDKRDSFIYRRKGMEMKTKNLSVFIVIPFVGSDVGFFHAIMPVDYSLDRSGHGRGREGGESTIPEREIRYETDDNEFKFASTKKASASVYSRNSTRYSSIARISAPLFILPLILTDSRFSSIPRSR